jgi:excinuclease ABC subunit C
MFRPRPTLLRPNRLAAATLYFGMSSSSFDFQLSTLNWISLTTLPATLARSLQITEKPTTLSPAFAALTSRIKHNPCVCHSYKKHPGWGVPSFCTISVLSALKSSRSLTQLDPSNSPRRPPSSALESTRIGTSATVASRELAPNLNPVDATLTKNKGVGVLIQESPSSRPLTVGCELSAVGSPLPLYPVTVLELDCGLEFDPARAEEDFFPALPPKPAVCLIETRAENAEPFLIRTQDLRRRLQRLLGPADATSRRLNLRELARGIRYRLTGSKLEQSFTYYQQAKQVFPKRYRKLARLRPPAVLKISLRNAYPRCYVTRSIAVDETGAPTAGAYYGPFPSRKSALAFSEQALDLFKVRRCQIKIRRDPTFPGCIYSEMKMCLAPCFAGCTKEEYDAEVQRLVQFLDTNGNSLRAAIEDDRERASADLDFERAAQLHKRIEKLDEALRFRPELARRIANLDAVILQRSAEDQSIGVFGVHGGRLAEPFFLRFAEIASQPRSAEHIFKDYLEGTPAAAQNAEKPAEGISTPAVPQSGEDPSIRSAPVVATSATAAREELGEHLALISRWFYSNPREGEIFFREKDWPYRKILRACSRLLNPKTAEPPASEPAASGNPSPP